MVLVRLEHLLLEELAVGLMEGLGGAVVVAAVHHLPALAVGPEALNVQDGVLAVLGGRTEGRGWRELLT